MPISSDSTSLLPSEYTLHVLKPLVVPTEGDLLAVFLSQIGRILSRTASGVTYLGQAFAPYAADRKSASSSSSSTLRTQPSRSFVHSFSKSKQIPKSLPISRRGPVPGISGLRTSFSSSGSGLGGHSRKTGTVNLRDTGKMLDSLYAIVGGNKLLYSASPPSIDSFLTPATSGEYGVLGERSEIARYQNEGTPRMPQREFLNSSPEDNLTMELDINARVIERLNIRLL